MNRIVLIGNGFDLAHGLKTSYEDFLDWYWIDWGRRLRTSTNREESDQLCSFALKDSVKLAGWYLVWGNYFPLLLKQGDEKEIAINAMMDQNLSYFNMQSLLFERICGTKINGWVNIEDVYYSLLKSIDNPKQINSDLEIIKEKLVIYLSEIQNDFINKEIFKQTIQNQILEPINREDIAIGSQMMYCDMVEDRMKYSDEKWNYLIDGYNISRTNPQYDVGYIHRIKKSLENEIERVGVKNVDESFFHKTFFLPNYIMLLDFNYTNTTDLYLPRADKFTINHIHGQLSNPKSVVFGYGDERDDEYEKLMKKNDNEYLQYIKSFRYSEASNYRRMLAFIESAPYQLCIMGHSCGISDRTLLSTLFEHDNCVSIKPYYYRRNDGTDNYRYLVQNIARNFSDPRKMRDRVVGKERCEALGKE